MKRGINVTMNVNNNLVGVINIEGIDYISLTDLARYKNPDNPGDVIIKWMSNKSSFDFYSLWEELSNEDFKLAEFREFKIDSSTQSFTMSPSRWIKETNAKGIISKIYLIKEFERLKYKESYQQKTEWSVRRSLAKTNYRIHTDSIKEYIVPRLTDKQKAFAYASEADIINVALFGMTAKEWRECNPQMEGNIRDSANILHLVVLSNLEVLNANMIEEEKSQEERLEKLNLIARKQLQLLLTDKNIIGISEYDKLNTNEMD